MHRPSFPYRQVRQDVHHLDPKGDLRNLRHRRHQDHPVSQFLIYMVMLHRDHLVGERQVHHVLDHQVHLVFQLHLVVDVQQNLDAPHQDVVLPSVAFDLVESSVLVLDLDLVEADVASQSCRKDCCQHEADVASAAPVMAWELLVKVAAE